MTKSELITQMAKKTNVNKKGVESVSEVPYRNHTAGSQERWTDQTRRARHIQGY